MPLACQLSECHFQKTTKTLPITRKPSTPVRGPPSLTLIAGTGASLTRPIWCRSAQCGPQGRWRTSPSPRAHGSLLGALRANDFQQLAGGYGQADGDHVSSRTDPDDAERLIGIFGSVIRRCCEERGPCPPRARKEGHPWRFTVAHGATGSALDLCSRRSAGRGRLLCKQVIIGGLRAAWPGSVVRSRRAMLSVDRQALPVLLGLLSLPGSEDLPGGVHKRGHRACTTFHTSSSRRNTVVTRSA